MGGVVVSLPPDDGHGGDLLGFSSQAPAPGTQPWRLGSIYGALTWLAMVFVVVPLSGVTGWKLPQGWNIVGGLLSHIFYVGVPIAHIVQYGLRDSHRPV